MRTLLSIIASLSHALWLGGTIALFIFVSATFQHSRELGQAANPVLFQKWEAWRLMLAGVAVVSALAWWWMGRGRLKLTFAALLVIATIAALISAKMVSPRIEALRVAGQTSTPEFKSAHGKSMMVYSTEALMLLVAGIILPLAQRKNGTNFPSRTLRSNDPQGQYAS